MEIVKHLEMTRKTVSIKPLVKAMATFSGKITEFNINI